MRTLVAGTTGKELLPAPAEFPWSDLPQRIFSLIGRFEWPCLVLLLIAEVFDAESMSRLKPLWYDEIFTIIVANQPTWHQFVLAMPPEANPPFNTGLTRLFFHLFGLSVFSLRLAPLLGFLSAMVGVFVLVRRECGAGYGLLAAAMLVAQPVSLYAFEARPYGMLLGFLTLALVGWQAAAHALDRSPGRTRALPLAAMAAGIVGCILTHNIGILEAGTVLCVAEAVRTIRRRRLDWPLILTGGGALSTVLLTLPLIRRTNSVVLVHAGKLTRPLTWEKLRHYPGTVKDSWHLLFDNHYLVAVLLLLAVAVVSRMVSSAQREGQETSPGGSLSFLDFVALGVGALLLLPVTWLAMIPTGGWYYCRYAIGSVIGLSVLTCVVLKRSRRAEPVLALLLLLVSLVSFVRLRLHYQTEFPVDTQSLAVITSNTSKLPVVYASGLPSFSYPAVWWYTPDALKSSLFFLRGSDLGTNDATLVEASLWAERNSAGMPIEELPVFLNGHTKFLLCSQPQGVLLKYLTSNGYTAKPYGNSGIAYVVERAS